MTVQIKEAAGTAVKTGPGRVKLTIISPGQGSSGNYSPEVLEQAAKDRVWPRGTQSHLDHNTEAERMERPEGSLRNLAGVLLEDAYVDTDGSLVAETRISSAWRDFVDDFGEFIGASIVASAEVSESKDGPVIERLIPSPFNRVDLVTVAGRGGRIAEVLEAAKVIEQRSVVQETTANDVDNYLRTAVRDAHRTDDDWAWLQDHDDTYVYYEQHGKTFRQQYTLDGVNVTLTGEPVEVRRRVEYDTLTTPEPEPTDTPSSPAGVTETQKEDAPMATTQIEEAELTELRESAGRVQTLEAELATERATRAEEATNARVAQAEAIVNEAFGDDAPAFLVESAKTLATAEDFDADALRTQATEAAAKIAEAHGAGTPRGNGETVTEAKTYTADDTITALEGK